MGARAIRITRDELLTPPEFRGLHPAEHQAARRVAIEPMRQGGVARQAKAQRREIILDIFAAFRAAMDRDPGRLVDDQHQPVAIKKARGQLFCRHGQPRAVTTLRIYHQPRHLNHMIGTIALSAMSKSPY